MTLFGLHILDVGIIALYVLVILWLGHRIGKGTKNTEDFYIAGRKLGKFYQFFLNFGNSTNADQAVAVSREIYRQGIGGMWIQYLVLFLTPFYWFTTMLYRRSRLITIGDYFTERFRSPFLGGSFAVFTLAMALIGGGVSYMVAGKTMMALTPKPESAYTQEERLSVERFQELQTLKAHLGDGLNAEEQVRYDELNERSKRGEIRSFISYTNPVVFYFAYAFIVAIYTVMGGFTAAAVTDAIQGFLIITFSFLLIPIGLGRIGGFEGLHQAVPNFKFALFGSAATSEYAWYAILAMVVANLVSIVAAAPMMATAGSAKNEMTARVGMIGGMFLKRFIMLFWALAGLLAIGLYGGKLSDPDLIWGHMTYDLLFPGAIGLMLAGILAANMSTLDATAVTNAALFVRNLYQPWKPNQSERHYINIGRIVILIVLLGGIGSALFVNNLLDLFKYFISLPAVFGASIWLGFIWRRLTKRAVILQVFICFTLYAIIPNLFQTLDGIRTHPRLLIETQPKTVMITTGAVDDDLLAGRAVKIGDAIRKPMVIEPTGIFFDKVVRSDPSDPVSPKIGMGRFHAEIWVLSWFKIDFSSASKAQLVATRFFFDALFPFLLLFIFSIITKPVQKESLDAFFGKIHTPVQPTPEAERRALEEAAKLPEIFEKMKIFPGSSWEILKPNRWDLWGFGGSWVMVGFIIFLLWLLVHIGG
ncbi:MAG: sodium:solute symporter family protein [Candidatus Eisenbacteria bacterium]|uniref:Sodium:solute symporter family protein n=1 Tax=Eiseniibacteriota bacterium TaxID=2212470 RepID=A0A948RZH8_UNCEI|nr:sodium:solute symporter family protein [Candidatus Eisenbacteria bacterium]MBU1947719.1 sodium:solute symporter family protein [Candidatus Eisenbacteria bacterium]MBU2692037.1 sodium:solute symporter family protein [Candidatus Eisenbacteria bacterium]